MGSQFSALDFEFLYVKDLTEKDALTTTVTSEDNLPRMNVWVVQDTEKIDLLKMVMKPENLEFSSAVIVLDLDQPWEMMNSLNRWMSILDEAIRPTMMQLPIKKQDEIKHRIASHILNYERLATEVENGNKGEQNGEQSKEEKKKTSKQKSRSKMTEGNLSDHLSESDEDEFMHLKSLLPLPDGVLTSNLGIPVVVVCHKVDLIGRGDKAQFLEQHIDFIQKNVRSYCLAYGASMMFTDIHQHTNLDILYRYLLHRLYDFDFSDKAQAIQKNSIFIPSGFDSVLLIEGLCKGTAFEKKVFEQVIAKPSQVNPQVKTKPEILTEEWHTILLKHHGGKGALPTPKAGQSMDEEKRTKMKGFYENLMKPKNKANVVENATDPKKISSEKKPVLGGGGP